MVAPRIPMEYEACYDYLQQIQHNLDKKHQQALELFFAYLIDRGEAAKNALPIKYFPGKETDTDGKTI